MAKSCPGCTGEGQGVVHLLPRVHWGRWGPIGEHGGLSRLTNLDIFAEGFVKL